MRLSHLVAFVGLLTFVSMLMLSLMFAEERTTFVDIAFQLYVQATTGEVAIQNHRFVSAFTQWIPTQLLRAEVNMKSIQLVYSLLFPLLYGGVWVFTNFVLKAKQWALAWALMWLTFATHTHYWIQSELPQGLAAFVLALGLMSVKPSFKWADVSVKLVVALLLFTVAFAHPLLIVPVTFSFGLLWLLGMQSTKQVLQYYGIYLISYLVKSIAFKTAYDAIASDGVKIGLKTLLRFEMPYSIPHFFENLASTYYAFGLLAVAAIWILWKSGSKTTAAWTLTAILGHIILVALAYSTSNTQDFYIENLYLPAGFMAGAGFAFGLKRSQLKTIVPVPLSILIITLVIFRIGHIQWIGDSIYRMRLYTLQAMVDSHKDEKVIYLETEEIQKDLITTWGTGYEAWVLSARNEKPTQGFIVLPELDNVNWAINDPNRLILSFHIPLIDELPKRYFKQPNNEQIYRVIQ